MTDPQKISYTTEEAAEYLGLAAITLNVWRHKGKGPSYVKMGSRVVYRLEALERWVGENSVHSQAEAGTLPAREAPADERPNKAAGTKDQRAKLEASPHWKFIASMLTWFHGPEHEHTQPLASLSPANYVATAAEIEHTLRIDMGDKKGCEHRLGTIVKHAAQDEAFWQRNLKSLRSLRKDSGNGPKWSVIESSMKAEETAKEDDDIRPPRISAAEVLGEL